MGKYDWGIIARKYSIKSLVSSFEPWKRIPQYLSLSVLMLLSIWVKKRNTYHL